MTHNTLSKKATMNSYVLKVVRRTKQKAGSSKLRSDLPVVHSSRRTLLHTAPRPPRLTMLGRLSMKLHNAVPLRK